MSDQTIRDVVIRVAIENGNMKLGPVDASAFTSSASAAIQQVQAAQMSGIESSLNTVRASQTSSQTASHRSITSIDGGALQKKLDAAKAVIAARKEELAQMSQAVAYQVQYSSAASQSSASVIQLAKSVGLLTTSSDEDAASMLNAISAIQGIANISSDTIGIVNTLAVAQNASAATATASAAATTTAATTASGATATTIALGGAAVGLSATFIVVGAAIAGGIATLAAWRLMVIETRKITESFYDMQIGKASAAAEAVARSSQIIASHRARVTSNEDLSSSAQRSAARASLNILSSEGAERSARWYEAEMSRSTDSKHQIRQMLESSDRFSETSGAQKDRLTTLREKKGNIQHALDAEEQNRTRMKAARANKDKALRDQQASLVKNSGAMPGTSNLRRGVAGIMSIVTGDSHYVMDAAHESVVGRIGMTAAQRGRHKELEGEIQKNQTDGTNEQRQSAQRTNDLAKEKLQTEQETLHVLVEQSKSVREYQNEAHRAVQAIKEKQKSFEVGVGKMDFSEQNYQMMIQDISRRNEKKRDANRSDGKDEDDGIEEYTQEMTRRVLPGSEAEIDVERQNRRTAKKLGLGSRADKEGQMDAAIAEKAKADALPTDQGKRAISQSGSEIKKMTEELKSSEGLLTAFEEYHNAVKEKYEELQEDIRHYKMKVQGWTPQ